MTIEFGDDEPEDAWDPGDAVPVLLEDLTRRARLLEPSWTAPLPPDQAQALDRLEWVVEQARCRDLDAHDLERARELLEDIGYLRGRV
jgi:hypothetical protein